MRRCSFSTQRNAGMSSFEPSRIPAWLAPGLRGEVGLPLGQACACPSASQRARFGALPSRIARCSTGSARPSISRKTIPGTSVLVAPPARRAIRWITRSVYVVVVVRRQKDVRSTIIEAAEVTSDGEQRRAERVDLDALESAMSDGQQQHAASSDEDEDEAEQQRERQPQRREDRRQHRVQDADQDEVRAAPRHPSISTPGTSQAARSSAALDTIQATTRRSGRMRGRSCIAAASKAGPRRPVLIRIA